MGILKNFTPLERAVFLAGLLLKLTLGTFFASSFLTELFAPFVGYFCDSNFANPYLHFAEDGNLAAFPYPAMMLYLLALPQLLIGHEAGQVGFLELFLYRVPLVAADMTIFVVLRSWIPQLSAIRLILLYWLSPVLIYITYIHGQLDSIPIAFIFLTTYFLFQNKIIFSAILFGLALSTKTNVVLIYPFFLIYFMERGLWFKKSVVFSITSVTVFGIVNAPFLLSSEFFETVFHNAEQNKVFLSFLKLNEIPFYTVPACWLFLLAFGARVGLANRDVFVIFTGFAFCVVLLLIPPQYGWYYWVLPFFCLFFAKDVHSSTMPLAAIQALYLLYFLVSPQSDYLQTFQVMLGYSPPLGTTYSYLQAAGLDAEKLVFLVFTFLQSSLLIICVQIYLRGLSRYRHHKITAKPFLIGVGGDSGVGKTTVSKALKSVFTDQNITVLRGDDQHRWRRGHEKWNEYTHLNPKANFLHKEIEMIRTLMTGRRIRRQLYDHSTGSFTPEMTVSPNRLMVLEGLHPFFLEEQRKLFDLKIFILPEQQLAIHWKICRDKVKRQYSTTQILEQIAKRRKDAEDYVKTQSQFADLLINCRPVRPIMNIGDESELVDLKYTITFANSLNIEPIVRILSKIQGLNVEHEFKDVDFQTIDLSGEVNEVQLKQISGLFDHKLQEIGASGISWPLSLLGVVVALIVHCIYEKAEYEKT